MTSTPDSASSAAQPWLLQHSRLVTVLGAVAIILLLLIVPPFVSISRYKRHVTELVSRSLGRPVRLSSVGWRVLPRPAFVLTDLTVDEDPAYGAEPVLHANTVVADVHLWSLWRGRLQLDKISVDEASLNLVRAANGRWNMDSLLQTATPSTSDSKPAGNKPPFPYLEATNSRINFKSSAEKLPYSLTNTDASLWQEDSTWRVRLRGQPVRTDVSLNAADTGIVRLEATLHTDHTGQASLHSMPLQVDLDWRSAQLGQLSRLILGNDEDWRGDLTGELHWDGTADAAKITTRLRANGVHRAEFAPAAQLDFDANCAFLYHYATRTAENVECNSPVGSGRARLTGSYSPAAPSLTLELDRVPAQAPLDLLRTLRGNLDQGLSASGAFSGKMTYAPDAETPVPPPARHSRRGRKSAQPAALPSPLRGAFTAENVRLSGEGLSSAIDIPKITLEPVPVEANQPPALAATLALPAGGPAPLAVTARLARPGFTITMRGAATLDRLRELATIAAIPQASVLTQLSADPTSANQANLDLRLDGPWLAEPSELVAASALPGEAAKKLSGSIVLHNVTYKSEFLAGPVAISAATLHLGDGPNGDLARWDPVAFSYGPAGTAVKATALLLQPVACASGMVCVPHFTLRFASLNAGDLQAALLGAKEKGTLLSTLLDRFRSAPTWPVLDGQVEADSLTVGRFAFTNASVELNVAPAGARITAFTARMLGGQVHGTGSFTAATGKDNAGKDGKPSYSLDGSFTGVKPGELGQLLGEKWSGGLINGSGMVVLSGFTTNDFASSAKGTLNFDWRNGRAGKSASSPLLAGFARWNGSAKIESSALTLAENRIHHGTKASSAEGAITFLPEAKAAFTTPRR